jgi:hypothetical protein
MESPNVVSNSKKHPNRNTRSMEGHVVLNQPPWLHGAACMFSLGIIFSSLSNEKERVDFLSIYLSIA